MSSYGHIEKLKREHLLDGFDCGKEGLNRFLKRQVDVSLQGKGVGAALLKDALRRTAQAAHTIGP